jgi:C7-cyclitol 7-kinase
MIDALVVDLGGTHLRCAAIDASGVLGPVSRVRIESVESGATAAQSWHSFVDHVAQMRREVASQVPDGAPLVCAVPGPVRSRRWLLAAPTLVRDAPVPTDLAERLEGATGLRVVFLNDLSAAAWHYAATTSDRRFVVVTVASGIGSKCFDRDHPRGVLDDPEWSGEIGHQMVDWSADASPCDCGATGHLGGIASGRGIERAARRVAPTDASYRQSVHGRHGVVPAALTNEHHLAPAFRDDDVWTHQLVRAASRPLAQVLATVVLATGSTRVHVMGGFAQALGPRYAALLNDELRDASRYDVASDVFADLVRLAPPSTEIGVLGGRAFVIANEHALRCS